MENAGTGPAFSFGWDDYAHGGFIFAIHGGTEPPPDTPARHVRAFVPAAVA